MLTVFGSGKINIDLLFSGLTRLPKEGEELYAKDFSLRFGGGAPATIINLARLGVDTFLQTYLGDDIFSTFAEAELKNSGARYSVAPTARYPLNITAVAVTPSDRTFLSYGSDIVVDKATKDAIYQSAKTADIVIMEKGYLDVYQQLKKEGKILVFDCGYQEDLTIANYLPYLTIVDYYLPNLAEALKITNTNNYMEASAVLSDILPNVIVKLDAKGAYMYNTNKIVSQIDDYALVDSTGAGDAFLAGFLYGVSHNFSLEKCALCGNITGGKCVTDIGCLTAHIKNAAELERLIAKYSYLLD